MLGIVFPHQLFEVLPEGWKEILFVRHDIAYGGRATTVANFHIARKVFFRAAEKSWLAEMKKKRIAIRVIERGDDWSTKEVCEFWDPVDHMLEKELKSKCPNGQMLESPAFILSRTDAIEILGEGGHAGFYSEVRRRTGILMRDGKPEGGKFRFDTENRKPVGSDVKLPNWTNELADRQSKFIKTAYTEIASDGKSLGEWAGDLVFPTTRSGCREALRKFVTTRLKQFGPYQDAIVENDDFLFHSVLSAPINAGLLTPADIISEALKHKASVPLQSLEGFLAQVIGWREFMRAVYYKYPTAPTNRLKHSRRLSEAWYNANTGLLPLDTAISRVNENAYLHHIERLMIVGNAMFLTQIHPDDCYRWFMEMFADSYDWVMIGNVYYMSQWASDAITTKPYISSSAYIRRMSDYKASDGGEWVKEWDALYWNAVHKHGDLLRKNYRMAAQVSFFQKKSDSDKSLIKSVAGTVIKRITRA